MTGRKLNDIFIHRGEVGGTVSRILSRDLADGRVALDAGGSTLDLHSPPQRRGGIPDVV